MGYTDEQKRIIDSESSDVQLVLSFPGSSIADITNSKIYSESMSLTESLYECEDIAFGKCNASCFRVRVADKDTDFVGKTLVAKLVITDSDNNSVNVPIGKYTVFSAEKSADRMWKDIVAYDYMTKFDVDIAAWYNNTLYPTKDTVVTVRNMFNSLCSYIGVECVDDISMVNGFLSVGKTIEPTTLSARDLLQSICEINGSFGHFNSNGKLEFIKFNREDLLLPREVLYPSNSLFPKSGFFNAPNDITVYKSCDYKDFETKPIDSVCIRMEDDDIGVTYSKDGNTNNMYSVLANFLTYGIDETVLTNVAKNLLDNISGMYFQPCNTTVAKGLYIEIGNPYDIFVVQPTEEEIITTQLTSYVVRRELNGIQAITSTFISEGNETQSEYVSSLNTETKILQGKYHNLSVDLETFKSEVGVIDDGTTLVSKIEQNAGNITSEVKRAKEAELDLSTLIEQTDERITLKVNNLQNQVNGQVAKYSGSSVPTLSNYPASSWNNDEKAANVGSVYTVNEYGGTYAGSSYRFMYDETNGYFWQEMTDTEIAELKQQIADLSSEINQTSEGITATVAKNMRSYIEKDSQGNVLNIKYYNYGIPENHADQWRSTVATDDLYLDVSNGKVYQRGRTSWSSYATLGSVTTDLYSQIDVTSEEISSLVQGQSNLSSRISQTAKSIDLSVNNGSTSSGITITVTNEDGTTDKETANISMTGLVSFSDLSNTSKTSINGGTIKTGTISAARLDSKVITTDNLSAKTISGSQIKGGTITGQTISGGTITGTNISSSDNFKMIMHYNALNTGYEPIIQSTYENIGTSSLPNWSSVAHFGRGINKKWAVYFDGYNVFNSAYFNCGSHPYVDNKYTLGTSVSRWYQLYATHSTSVTSDRNQKRDITEIPEKYESMFSELNPVTYYYKDGDRVHVGFIAQEVEEAMNNNDISNTEYGALCKDEVDGKEVYGLRYEEFIALNTHMIQKQQAEISELKEQIAFLIEKLEKLGGNK